MVNRDRLDQIIETIGEKEALSILERHIKNPATEILTIVANKGVHYLPREIQRGFVHVASQGNLDFSSIHSVEQEYQKILTSLSDVLQSRMWGKIYLVPFGPSTLSMQIKLLVYRITRIETVDVFYDGKGGYFDLSIDQRALIVSRNCD